MLKPIYVKMPITVDQKHEYHRQGLRAIDERFRPEDAEDEPQVEEEKPRQRRRRNAAEDEE